MGNSIKPDLVANMPKCFAMCAALLVSGGVEGMPQQHGISLKIGRFPIWTAFMYAAVAEDGLGGANPATLMKSVAEGESKAEPAEGTKDKHIKGTVLLEGMTSIEAGAQNGAKDSVKGSAGEDVEGGDDEEDEEEDEEEDGENDEEDEGEEEEEEG